MGSKYYRLYKQIPCLLNDNLFIIINDSFSWSYCFKGISYIACTDVMNSFSNGFISGFGFG